MDFAVRELDQDIVKLAADFAEKRLAPTVKERDEKEVFDRKLIDEMGELGLLGIPYEEEYGGVGAQALGIAEGAFHHALTYATERVQFGKPIAKFQAVSFLLADMKAKIEAARYLVYKAAYSMNQGGSYSMDAAIAKKVASDVAMQVTTDAVQIFGGYGFTREYPVERYMRDAKITQIYEGTTQVQQMVISGALLR